jgi:hypothetical protein
VVPQKKSEPNGHWNTETVWSFYIFIL